MLRNLVLAAMVMGLFACKRAEPQAIATVVDSIFPVEEEVRRFKAARRNASTEHLTNASDSPEQLIARFRTALQKRDTADLRAMLMNPAEFIDLYYARSVYARPPFKQSPELLWFLTQQTSEKGIKRALDRYGGAPLSPVAEQIRLHGPILHHAGRFKFVSYANDL